MNAGPAAESGVSAQLVEAVMHLGRLALTFGGIDRTACYHTDGVVRESDSDHTVMLGWIAPALAARCYPRLDVGLVAQYSLVHDAVETYAGDTQTLRIDGGGHAAKQAREAAALERIHRELDAELPWFPTMISQYERQADPEARFVRAVDKTMPKIVHILDGLTGLREFDIRHAELERAFAAQLADMRRYVGEFGDLLAVHTEIVHRVLDHPNWDDPAIAAGQGGGR